MEFSNNKLTPCSSKEILQQSHVVADLEVESSIADGLEKNPKTDDDNNLWEYEDILNILGFGKTQWVLLLISGLLTMTSIAGQLSLGIIAISSKCEFNMSQKDMGLMMTTSVAGIVLSTYIWGYISDIWGRRTVLIWTMLTSNLLQFIMMFVTNIWLFNIINLIMGISLGGTSGAIYPYLGEFNIAKNRAVVINYSTMFVSITNIYVPVISWLVLSSDWSLEISESFVFKPWRLIIFFSLLPGLWGALWLLYFPESPKLLLAHNKHAKALEALKWISKYNKGLELSEVMNTHKISLKPEELAEADLLTMGRGCSLLTKIWKATLPLFQKPHGLNVTLAVLALFGMMFCSGGLQVWFSDIANRTAKGLQMGKIAPVCGILEETFKQDHLNITLKENIVENKICDDSIEIKTYIDSIIMGFAFLVGFSIQGALLNPLGRKNILLSALALGSFCSILLYVITDTNGILIFFCLCVLLPGLTISIMCGAMVDLVPIHLRGKAVSLALTLGRVGIVISSNLVAAMLEPYCSGIFVIVTGTLLVCGGLIYFLPI